MSSKPKSALRQGPGAAQLAALDYLREHPGATTAAVTRGIGRQRAQVATTLDRLVQRGLVVEDGGRWSIAEGGR